MSIGRLKVINLRFGIQYGLAKVDKAMHRVATKEREEV